MGGRWEVGLPSLLRPCVLGEVTTVVVRVVHVEIARKVPVVVRTRIRGIVPVKSRVAVLAESVKHCGRGRELLGLRCEVVLEDGDRLVGLADAGVAHLAVIVAPVGVVHVVAHQIVDLLGGTVLRSTLARGGHECESQLMLLAEPLLHGSVVAERAVENTLYPVISAKPRRCAESVGPAVVQLSGSVGQHQAEPVQSAVGQHASSPACADGRGHRHDVREAVVAAESEIGDLGSVHGLLASGGLVETAPEGVRRVTRDSVVHPHASKIDILRLTGIAADTEAHGTEIVAGHVVEHIVLAEKDGRAVLVAGIVHVELGETGVVHLGDLRHRSQGEVEHILDIAVIDGHVHSGLEIVRAFDDKVVHSVLQVPDLECSVLSGLHTGDFLSF